MHSHQKVDGVEPAVLRWVPLSLLPHLHLNRITPELFIESYYDSYAYPLTGCTLDCKSKIPYVWDGNNKIL